MTSHPSRPNHRRLTCSRVNIQAIRIKSQQVIRDPHVISQKPLPQRACFWLALRHLHHRSRALHRSPERNRGRNEAAAHHGILDGLPRHLGPQDFLYLHLLVLVLLVVLEAACQAPNPVSAPSAAAHQRRQPQLLNVSSASGRHLRWVRIESLSGLVLSTDAGTVKFPPFLE